MATTKHLSYAGTTLPLLPPQYEAEWLRVHPDPYTFLDYEGWNFDAPSAPALPSPSIPTPPEFSFNKLHWPTGASRPAWFHAVVTADRLAAIKSAVGSYAAPADLVFYDGRAGKTVTARMRMLPERPLNVSLGTSASQAWIVTLTDDRFFWYYKRGVVTAPTSWTNLFSQLGSLLGVSVAVDAVNSAYGTPSAKWARNYSNTNVLLDGAAAQVGQRVVVGLDGSVRTVNWETAKGESDAYFSGSYRVVSGGLTPDAGTARTGPSKVRSVFGESVGGTLGPTPYVVENTLASLAVAGYGAATGVPDTHETVFADLAYTGTNAAACAAYAAAAATDFYGWQLTNADLTYPGVEPWVPTGWEDRIEWRMWAVESPDEPSGYAPLSETSVRRGSFLSFEGGDYIGGLAPPIPCEWIPGGCGSGGGSGSGSGSGSGGCGVTVLPVEFTCSYGVRTATVSEIAVGVVDGQLVIEECGTTETELGACSPVNPGGTTIPVATKVCPVYAGCVTVTHAMSPYTITDADAKIVVDASAGTVDLVLPPWAHSDVWFTVIVADDSNAVTLIADTALPDLVNGDASIPLDAGQWSNYTVEALCTAGEWVASAGAGGTGGVTSFNARTGAVTLTALDVTDALGYTPGTGDGTVTVVSVVTANGVSGSVATDTTTPAITISLGSITPTSVNGITFSGSGALANSGTSSLTAFTGSGTSSGTNTGNQNLFSTIAVSGQSDVVADTTADTLTFAAGTGVTITTDPTTDTVTITATGSGGTVTSVSGTANQVSVATGTTTPVISLIGPHGFTTQTNHGVLLGQGTGAIVATAAMTDGQLLVGQTGADPLPKTVSGDVTIAASGATTLATSQPAAHTWGALQTVTVTDAVTNAASDVLVLDHESSGTPAANFGLDVHVKLKSSTTASQDASLIRTYWIDATHASRRSGVTFLVYDATAARIPFAMGTSGAAAQVSFLGAALSAQLASPDIGTALNTFGFTSGTPTFAVANLSGAGTGVLTALAANVGSAGAFVTFNGAGGTPSSLTLTNATGLPAAGVTGTAVVQARTLTAAGLVTGGGDLSANRTFTVTAAVQSDQETGTSNAVAVTPGVQQYHKSAAKAWVHFDASSGTPSVLDSYNVSSISDNGVGLFTINFTTAFSSANYATAGMATTPGTTQGAFVERVSRTASAFPCAAVSLSAVAAFDASRISGIFFGDQ